MLENACIVCLEVSPGMFKIESNDDSKSSVANLLSRFGGLTISTGKICKEDHKSLLRLTRIADNFYNKCQKSLLKRLNVSPSRQSIWSRSENDNIVSPASAGDTDIGNKVTDEIDNGTSLDHVEVKTEKIESDTEVMPTFKKKNHKHVADDSDTDVDYWESDKDDEEYTVKKSSRRLTRSSLKSQKKTKIEIRLKKSERLKKKNVDSKVSKRKASQNRERVKKKRGRVAKSDEEKAKEKTVEETVSVKEEEEEEEDGEIVEGEIENGDANSDSQKKSKSKGHEFESGICYLCGSVFSSRSGFQAHMNSHKKDTGHKCEICDKSYTRLSYLRLHVRKEHSEIEDVFNVTNGTLVPVPKDLPCFICHQCGKCLTSRGKLKYHMEGHSAGGANKPHACTLCEKKFRQANALKIHMRRHTGELPFQCSLCDGRFTDAYSLRRHQQYNHSPGSSVPCSECNRHFASPEELAEHMPIHNRAKAYKCPSCGRGFRNRSNLSKHKKIHTGIKACACTQCPARFRTMTHLKRHVNMVHNEIKPFQCPICNGKFTSSQSLKRHGWLHTQAWKEKRDLVLIPPVTDVSPWLKTTTTDTSVSGVTDVTMTQILTPSVAEESSQAVEYSAPMQEQHTLSSLSNVPIMLVSSSLAPTAPSPVPLTISNISPYYVKQESEGSAVQGLGYNSAAMRSMLEMSQIAVAMSSSASSMPVSLGTLPVGLPLQAFQTVASTGQLTLADMGASGTPLVLMSMVAGADSKPIMRLENMSPVCTPVSPPGTAVSLITKVSPSPPPANVHMGDS